MVLWPARESFPEQLNLLPVYFHNDREVLEDVFVMFSLGRKKNPAHKYQTRGSVPVRGSCPKKIAVTRKGDQEMGMLPVGTRVHVATFDGREYNGLVKGYDLGKTKYQVSPELFKDSEEFAKSLTNWAFPMEVEELVWDIMNNAWVTRAFWNEMNPK